MKLSVLALDYDGTIARDDRLDPSVRDAIADARRRGIAVMLVTGRNLVDLRRVAGDLHFVDGVVAENGALLHFPDSGVTTPLSPPVSPAFLARLRERGIPFQAGHSIVDADADVAGRMLDVIRELDLPVVLLFNRSRVLALNQGIRSYLLAGQEDQPQPRLCGSEDRHHAGRRARLARDLHAL